MASTPALQASAASSRHMTPFSMSFPGQRSRIHSRSRQHSVGSNCLPIHWASEVRLPASAIRPSSFPNDRLGARSTPQPQRGRMAMSRAFRKVSLGGTAIPFLISLWRLPCTVRSAVSMSAEHCASRARRISSRVNPRSRMTYSWNQNGSGTALCTCSIEQIDIVLRQNGMPALAAARAPRISPPPHCRPARPVGAMAIGSEDFWPASVVLSERSSTSIMIRCFRRNASIAERFSNSVSSSNAPRSAYSNRARGTRRLASARRSLTQVSDSGIDGLRAPCRAVGKLEFRDGGRANLRRESGQLGRKVTSIADAHRINEMLVEVVDELNRAIVHLAADRDIVGHGQMLHQFAQAHAAGMREDPDAILGSHEQDRQVLVHATDAGGIDLHEIDRLRLEKLFEDDPILCVFARRDGHRMDCLADRGMAQHVVRAGRLLDPGEVEGP